MPRFTASIAALFLLMHSVESPAAGCEKDTDCKGDRICESGACVSPGPAEDAPPAEDAAPAEDTPPAGDAPAAEDAPPADDAPPAPTDPKDWWKETSREAEAPVLQAIFNRMPKPIIRKDNGKLVYQRAVPLVVADVHNTTARWGGKAQIGVHFLGISKIHTTTTLEDITVDTGGIPYCPLNCARLTSVELQGNDIVLFYDDEIKEWAGKVADNLAGYTRKLGKQYRTMCTFPTLYSHAPSNAWLDPEAVAAVNTSAVNEIKRYCGMD
ncbi:MAG: hypothetical protein VX944_14145 [Myxococcota bacterium]|nr:hypothetical protein [Myxococcota bacterium]MEC9391210.1 hypothetical protein [Myxococcota bacterium]